MPLAVLDKLNPVPPAFLKQARTRCADCGVRVLSAYPTACSRHGAVQTAAQRRSAPGEPNLRVACSHRGTLSPGGAGVGAGQRVVHPPRYAVCARLRRRDCNPAARARYGARISCTSPSDSPFDPRRLLERRAVSWPPSLGRLAQLELPPPAPASLAALLRDRCLRYRARLCAAPAPASSVSFVWCVHCAPALWFERC